MPTPARLCAMIALHGRLTLLRLVRDPITAPPSYEEVEVFAAVRGYQPAELVGGLKQGDREVRIAQVELDKRGAGRAPRAGDQIVIDGRACRIEAPNTMTLRGAPALHVMTARGG